VAVLAYIFRHYAVQPKPHARKTMQQAYQRIFDTKLVIDHEGTILHEIRHSETISLTWTKLDK
jgi:hypothetical protein